MCHSIFRHSDNKRTAFIRDVTLPIQPSLGYLLNLRVAGLAKRVRFKVIQIACHGINEGDKISDESAYNLTLEIQQDDTANPFSIELFNALVADTKWTREIVVED